GLVQNKDISRILPLEKQQPYMSTWRDPTHDNDTASTPLLNAQAYIDKLNSIRKDNGVKPLRYQPKLEQSARLRAQTMLRTNDLSFEATRSGYTMERAMKDVGYRNIIWGEAPTLGYYTADELLQNYAEFPEWKKFLLDDRYQETGIATVVGQINKCPVQIVVQHVAGYQPPNYNQSDVQSWKEATEKLRGVLPSWENARTFGSQYEERKGDYEKMIQLIHDRISIAETVYERMSTNQWLTDEEQELIKKDKDLASMQEVLGKSLNQ
ncbi:MAG TPA: CAP domain-containing protein, partial [Patescibacteria group bacterium]|nr:CAP domain-containing protein [Patescibacteria group bacterium]